MYNIEKLELTDIVIQLEKIDYLPIIEMLKPIITIYITSRVINGYHLHKDFKVKNISKISITPELTPKYSNVDIEKLASQSFGDAIVKFAKLIMARFPAKNLINFYNNINELQIKKKKCDLFSLLLSNLGGYYYAKNNQIVIYDNDYELPIYHELFHMASAIYRDGVHYGGFRQHGSSDLGEFLNEGYTQLLTERYFDNVEKAYPFEVHVVDKLEKIIGQEKMESLYLNANLLGLIDELKNYSSEEDIM